MCVVSNIILYSSIVSKLNYLKKNYIKKVNLFTLSSPSLCNQVLNSRTVTKMTIYHDSPLIVMHKGLALVRRHL